MRRIVLHLNKVTDEQYVHIANAVWMLARATDCDFSVEADGDLDLLDEVWDDYGQVSWKHGARRGTPTFEAFEQIPD